MNRDSAPLRRLLPYPDHAPGQENTAELPVKRKRVPVACLHCRSRKSKCDGATPTCSACIRRKSPCIYTEDRKNVAKRKFDELDDRYRAQAELFDLIRTGKEDEVQHIVHGIRRGDDARNILKQLKDGDLLLQIHLAPETWCRYPFPLVAEMPEFLSSRHNPYFKSLIYEHAVERPHPAAMPTHGAGSRVYEDIRAQYSVPYRAAKVADPRFDLLNLTHWTSVTATNDYLKELLESYFLHEYPIFPFFHKDSFLDDLVHDRDDFCSKLLINAVLAAGCQTHSKTANRTHFWEPGTILSQFSAEARRLWDLELEVPVPSLTTVQAGLVMSLTNNVNGVDTVGWTYLVRANVMAARLKVFDPLPYATRSRLYASKALTAWTLFIWQSIFCFHFYRPPLLQHPPKVPLPNLTDRYSWYPELWLLYPSTRSPVSANYGAYFKARAEFQTIINSISTLVFKGSASPKKLSLNKTQVIYNGLQTWYRNLPDALSTRQVILPWQLSLHMHYFNIIDSLMEPFTKPGNEGVRMLVPPVDADMETAPSNIKTNAETSLETVFRLYYMRHGFEGFDPLQLQFLNFVGYMAIKKISSGPRMPPQTVRSFQSTVALAVMGLRDQGKNSYLAGTIFRLLRDEAETEKILLANEIVAPEEDDSNKKYEIAQHVKSQFPINVQSISDDPRDQRIESLISEYGKLR